jgi:hypothetical protein
MSVFVCDGSDEVRIGLLRVYHCPQFIAVSQNFGRVAGQATVPSVIDSAGQIVSDGGNR